MRNFSAACERNQNVIFEKLLPRLTKANTVFEIGSGSGQHALFFQQQLREQQITPVLWQCSDRGEWLSGLVANILEMDSPFIPAPLDFDVDNQWPQQQYDLVYTANSLHIMSLQNVENLFANLPAILHAHGVFCCYGPFKYNGEFTSPSNENFEQWLKERDIKSGIKDFETIKSLAAQQNITLLEDIMMPANNQLLIWQLN